MRHRASRGLTLVELMIALAIGGVLVVAAAPYFGDYIRNSRLRESGNTLYTEALIAQSEAIKRNTTVGLSTAGSVVQVIDRTVPGTPVVLRERTLAEGVSMATATLDFVAQGRPKDFVGASIDLSYASATCSSEIRCPGLRIDGGGSVRLCGDHTSSCP